MKTNELCYPMHGCTNLTYMSEEIVIIDFRKPAFNMLYKCEDFHHERIEITEVEK